MQISEAHIAGIGISEAKDDTNLDGLAVSAGTKALLDAGITYRDVDQSIAGFLDEHLRVTRSCFDVYGQEGAPICEVDNRSALYTAVQCIMSRQRDCALIVGIDTEASSKGSKTQVVIVAMVLVSSNFLTSHAYLKDGAICIRGYSLSARVRSRSSTKSNESGPVRTAVQSALGQAKLQAKDMQLVGAQQDHGSHARQALHDLQIAQPREQSEMVQRLTGTTGLTGLCGIVWLLRGWARDQPRPEIQNCLQCISSEDGLTSAIVLCRSDGRAAPDWSEIENVRDGRERLGYNPVVEMRAIAREDLDAVKGSGEFESNKLVRQLRLRVKGGDRAALARL